MRRARICIDKAVKSILEIYPCFEGFVMFQFARRAQQDFIHVMYRALNYSLQVYQPFKVGDRPANFLCHSLASASRRTFCSFLRWTWNWRLWWKRRSIPTL